MIEILKKYYDLEIKEYKQYKNGIVFFINGYNYYFVKSFLDIDLVNESYENCKWLKKNNIKVHDFIFNKNNELLSEKFVLFRINVFIEDITFEELNIFSRVKVNNYSNYVSMNDFWFKKIDYIEKQIIELSSNKLVNYSYDYFIGLGEMLLLYLKDNYIINNDFCFVHRTLDDLSSLEFYNPLNIMVGDKYKDFVAYIRLMDEWDLFLNLVDSVNYNDKVYIFVRMCFPFKYFELISKIVLDNENDSELALLLGEIDKYEEYLNKVEKMCGITLFLWLKKE